MIVITLANINNLNASLQVGDMIYVVPAPLTNLFNSSNENGFDINANKRVGILRRIEQNTFIPTNYTLSIDNTDYDAEVDEGDFIMFSKYNQSDDDIKGYYMEVKLVNDSRQKAELFSLGSEVTESSK